MTASETPKAPYHPQRVGQKMKKSDSQSQTRQLLLGCKVHPFLFTQKLISDVWRVPRIMSTSAYSHVGLFKDGPLLFLKLASRSPGSLNPDPRP